MARRRKTRRASAKKRSRRTRLVVQLLLLLLLAGAVGAGVGLAWLWPRCSGADCPSVTALRSYTPPQATRVFDRDGDLLAHLAPERRIVVPLEKIPAHVSGAFLAVEDRRFFRHAGVDYRRVGGSVLRNLRSRSFDEGFSTITMQLARNVFPEHLTRAKTLRRKLWEVMLARKIEEEFSKDEILEMYLNQIYLGEGLYGVEAAAQGYFGKRAQALNAEEAALLAALPKAPSYYNPRQNPDAALQRRNLSLRLMAHADVITAEQMAAARDAPLRLVPPAEARGAAPYLVAAVREELRERFGPRAETAGLRVITTVDRDLQAAAAEALREQIEAVEAGKLGKFRHRSCSGDGKGAAEGCLQGLFVAVDVRTGDVLAMVGGRDYGRSQFNRVLQARRQAGSAFKPIVFAAALAEGIPSTTALVGPGAEEYEGGYRPADHVADTADVDMREALRMSSNRAAVALGERVGVGKVVAMARALGLTTKIPEYPSTVLGAADVVPLELVTAFAAFSNDGVVPRPRLIRRVEDSEGRVVWDNSASRRQAISPEVAFLTVDLMRDVVDRGTGSRVRRAGLPYSVPAAGKTGTTNEAADVWFVGVTPDVAAGVWLGFDQPKRIMHGASGGTLAAPVWGEALAAYYRKRPAPAAWEPPAGLVSARIDRETGQLATSRCPEDQTTTAWFLPGTAPDTYCVLHPEPTIEGWLQRTLRGVRGVLGGDRRDREPTVPDRLPDAAEPAPPR